MNAPAAPARLGHDRPLRVAIIGNPNTGKTTLFNALTGLRQRVGNFAGVTVERVEGAFKLGDGRRVTILDLPGSYSLTAGSPDEQIALEVLLKRDATPWEPDVVLVVVDAVHLDRNLFLASQVCELGLPVVIALNQIDVAESLGIRIDVPELIHELGVPVIPTVASRGEGLDPLRHALFTAAALPAPTPRFAIDASAETSLARHKWIGEAVARTVTRRARQLGTSSDHIDAIALHRVGGPLLFLVIMALVFQAVFSWAAPLQDGIESLVLAVGARVGNALPVGDLRSLVVDGVFAGVGSVLVFLPQIAILFGFIGILEHSGYMARAAFLMDGLMRRVGLHGKSFIPMLSGYACAVPGIMATRTIEDPKDRLATIMVVPLMSCSARLPVYTLLIGTFIPALPLIPGLDLQGATMLLMYLLGTITALAIAALFRKTLLRGPVRPMILELPLSVACAEVAPRLRLAALPGLPPARRHGDPLAQHRPLGPRHLSARIKGSHAYPGAAAGGAARALRARALRPGDRTRRRPARLRLEDRRLDRRELRRARGLRLYDGDHLWCGGRMTPPSPIACAPRPMPRGPRSTPRSSRWD